MRPVRQVLFGLPPILQRSSATISPAKELLSKNKEVIASLAPSFLAAFPGTSFPR
jgi:hypothetical protein